MDDEREWSSSHHEISLLDNPCLRLGKQAVISGGEFLASDFIAAVVNARLFVDGASTSCSRHELYRRTLSRSFVHLRRSVGVEASR